MIRILSLLIISVTITNTVCAQKNELCEIADSLHIAGMQVSYLKDSEEVDFNVGHSDIDKKNLVTSSTVFQCASMSKVVAAYVFLKLYDQGLFDLDVPLSAYYNYNRLKSDSLGDKITARMVLNHTSGLVNWQVSPRSNQWISTPLKVQFEPGSRFLYSGEGFYYLQLVVEHLTGKSLESLTREHVYIPFGMTRSGFVINENLKADLASGHDENGNVLNLKDFTQSNSAYTLMTTSSDYMKFVKNVFIEKKGLKDTTYDMMINASVPTDKKVSQVAGKYIRAGLGIRVQYNEKGQALWHTGSNTGFRSFFIVYPSYKEAIVVLTNSANGADVKKDTMSLFFGDKQTYWFLK